MRNDRVNYVLVGVFVLAMLAGVIVTIAALTGRTGATDVYYTRYDDATGIKYGTQVLYMGYPVGQVEAIEPVFEDDHVSFELELAISEDFAGWKVPRDSVAQVRAAGLLAAITVDIRAGTSSEPLTPGDHIRGVSRNDVFGAVSDTANLVRDLAVSDIKPLLVNLNHYVATVGEVLERQGGPLLENLGTLSAELAGRAPGVIDDFLATTRDLRALATRLDTALGEANVAKVGTAVDNVLAASEDLARITGNARGQLALILSDDMTARLQRTMANADSASADLAALGGSARRGVEAVLSSDNVARVERTLANLDEASASARSLVGTGRLAKVDAAVDSAGAAAHELEAMIADARKQVHELLRPETVHRFDTALVNISGAAANVARLSDHLDRRMDDVLTPEMTSKVKRALESFSLAAANVATLTRGLEDSRTDLDALLVALRGMAEDNRADVRASVRDLAHGLDVVARHIDAVAQNLEGSSRNMLEFSRRLKANPGLLLRGGEPAPDTGRVPGG